MDSLRVAIASNDGIHFNKEHFGDSDYYYIYELGKEHIEFIKKINNVAKDIEEKGHADPEKAGGVSKVLKKENIQVVVSGVFGPNLKRITKNFVCIIIRSGNLEDGLKRISQEYSQIKEAWQRGKMRSHLQFNLNN